MQHVVGFIGKSLRV